LEARDWLRPDAEAVYYRDDNLAGLLAHYLDHEEERARVAAAGHAKSPGLAMENRLDAFFDWMSIQPVGGRAFIGLDDETKALADLLFHGNSMEPAQRQMARAMLPGLLARNPSAAMLLAAGCMAFDQAADSEPALRGGLVKESLGHFLAVVERTPGEAVPWLNLAAIARLAGDRNLERRWLERAVAAGEANHGGLLLGKVTDPWYADWRRALAAGDAPVSLLRAGALARLAEHALESGNADEALALARESIERHPAVGYAYRLAGRAALGLGDAVTAVRYLVAGLDHTAFDVDHRMLLIDALEAAGRFGEARARAAESARIFEACLPLRDAAARFRSRDQ
jgi:tetratricopeptide (TPR) repeat protein